VRWMEMESLMARCCENAPHARTGLSVQIGFGRELVNSSK
jgi:hypothetical protein